MSILKANITRSHSIGNNLILMVVIKIPTNLANIGYFGLTFPKGALPPAGAFTTVTLPPLT
jgi:hypothetical protein